LLALIALIDGLVRIVEESLAVAEETVRGSTMDG